MQASRSIESRDRARVLRRLAADAEKKFWWHLRSRLPVEGSYFRRQVPLGPYFADFCCLKHRLIVELDGDQHGRPEGLAHDARRSAYLERSGFRLMRFWNHEVFTNIDGVIETIYQSMHPDGDPSLGGANSLSSK